MRASVPNLDQDFRTFPSQETTEDAGEPGARPRSESNEYGRVPETFDAGGVAGGKSGRRIEGEK